MFRNFSSATNKIARLQLSWIAKIPGVIRTAIIDSDTRGYVVVFLEKTRQYSVVSFDLHSGQIIWNKEILNGGYGTPGILNDTIVVLYEFTSIIALSKANGDQLWTHKTSSRVRSSINVVDNKIYFSSGGTIFEMNEQGDIEQQWQCQGAFFYGSVDRRDDFIYSCGVINSDEGESTIKVFCFNREGTLVYAEPISVGPVVSSDTSGIAWSGRLGFTGGTDALVCFNGSDGTILWSSYVNGFAGRQVPSLDNKHVYYVTQQGEVGALRISDGTPVWKIRTRENRVVSPMTVVGDKVMLLADGYLNLLKSENGQLLYRTAVGHTPYSMVSVGHEHAVVGGGEPPHNGLLFSFKLCEQMVQDSYRCSLEVSNAFIEEPFIDVLVNIANILSDVSSVELDAAVFHSFTPLFGERLSASSFIFRLPIPKNLNPGTFVVPLRIITQDEEFLRTGLVTLERSKPNPPSAFLANIPEFTQEQPNYSGAAIGAAIKSLYGDSDIEQSALRKMVDASRELAGYEAFQTWRLVLRRVLASSASEPEQLPEIANPIQ